MYIKKHRLAILLNQTFFMTTTTSSQLQNETIEWIQSLRNYRDVFQKAAIELQMLLSKNASKMNMHQTSHFDYQLQIQLKNIHDLKQKLKTHHRKIQLESNFQITNQTIATHEAYFEHYTSLESMLKKLSIDIAGFVAESSISV